EVVPQFPVDGPSVGDGKEDDIPFVALDILQVLYEEPLLLPPGEEVLKPWITTAPSLDLVQDSELLPEAERSHPHRQVRRAQRVLDDRIHNPPGLDTIHAGSFVDPAFDVFEMQPPLVAVRLDTG